MLHAGYDQGYYDHTEDIQGSRRWVFLTIVKMLKLNVQVRILNSLRYSRDDNGIASLYVKQDKNKIYLPLSQLIVYSLAHSRRPDFNDRCVILSKP